MQTFPYRLNEETGFIDYDKMEETAALYRPKLLVAGASAYTRHYDYPRMRKIADNHNAYLMSDMAHISGLVAAGAFPKLPAGAMSTGSCSGALPHGAPAVHCLLPQAQHVKS